MLRRNDLSADIPFFILFHQLYIILLKMGPLERLLGIHRKRINQGRKGTVVGEIRDTWKTLMDLVQRLHLLKEGRFQTEHLLSCVLVFLEQPPHLLQESRKCS